MPMCEILSLILIAVSLALIVESLVHRHALRQVEKSIDRLEKFAIAHYRESADAE